MGPINGQLGVGVKVVNWRLWYDEIELCLDVIEVRAHGMEYDVMV
jgi:hypothetical protein